MNRQTKRTILGLVVFALLCGLYLGLRKWEQNNPQPVEPDTPQQQDVIDENGFYSSKKDVALYIHTYGHLPPNYVTKNEARKKGWEGGNIEAILGSGYAIGGDSYANREGLLPKASGRKYYECDIDTVGYKDRGSRRIIYSNDGLIYYTGDHYEHFELLYGEE
ncbi:MAG: ribonuclease [Erysipelotrichaceae bacterium]|nr:ribonuclease [Erysipelotrichaceae bacterium]